MGHSITLYIEVDPITMEKKLNEIYEDIQHARQIAENCKTDNIQCSMDHERLADNLEAYRQILYLSNLRTKNAVLRIAKKSSNEN